MGQTGQFFGANETVAVICYKLNISALSRHTHKVWMIFSLCQAPWPRFHLPLCVCACSSTGGGQWL